MKRLFLFLLIVVLLLAAHVAYVFFRPIGPAQQKFILLRPGSSARHIARQLKDEGLIRSAPAFLVLHWLEPAQLKAGEYLFDHPANMLEVYGRLARGDIYTHTVVIPEGYNIWEIAAALEAAGLGPQQEFLELAQSQTSLIADLDPAAASLEGYLFPDTYQFTRTQGPRDMLAAMVHRFRREIHDIGLNGDFQRIVTMASIVEKETAAPEERPLVASVYYNRLKKNIALGADPTVVYGAMLAGHYRGTIFQSDLASDSAYNTYKRRGLPPGPIANPGRSSLLAAMHPAESDYLYFVSDNNGHHRFARTSAEHERNVAAYRKAAAAH